MKYVHQMRGGALVALLAASALIITACAGGPNTEPSGAAGDCDAADPVKIGALLPLSGGLADGGQAGQAGYELAEEDINAAGGIEALDGRCVEVVFADHEGDPAKAAQLATQLVQRDGAVALSGTYTSATGLSASEASQQLGVPWLQTVGLANSITDRGLDLVFRNKYNTSMAAQSGIEFLQWLGEQTGKPIEKIAIVWENSTYGTEGAESTKKAAEEAGIDVVADPSFKTGTADLSSVVSVVKAASPDVIIAWDFEPDSISLLRSMQTLDMNIPFIAPGGGILGQGVIDLGGASDGVLALSGFSADLTADGAADVATRYENARGVAMNDDAAAAYQGVWLLADAIEKAASDEPTEIADGLRALEVTEGPGMIIPSRDGRFTFGDDGQSPDPALLVLQLQDGEFKTVWPEEYASTDFDAAAAGID